MRKSVPQTLKQRPYSPLAYLLCGLYLIELFVNLCQYINLLIRFKNGKKIQDGISLIEFLLDESEFAPPLSSVILRSVYIIAFISLIVCIVALFYKRIRGLADIIATVCVTIFGLCSLFIWIQFPNQLVLQFIILLLTAIVFFYIGFNRRRYKVKVISYIIALTLTSVEHIAFASSASLPVLDVAILTLLSILEYSEKNINQITN